MSGCFKDYEQDSRLSSRFDLLQEAIGTINADFIGLVDTFKWKETFTEDTLKEKFKYKHVFLVDMEDTRVKKNIGIAVMTNLAVKEFNVIRAFNRNCIETVIDGLIVYTCYFDDLSEDTRLKEAASLLDQIKNPAIIHGDLNTFTKNDMTKFIDAEEAFKKDNKELFEKLRPVIDEMRRGEVIKMFENRGFTDAEKNATPTMPSKLFQAQTQTPFIRVDYILHTKEVAVADTKVHTKGLFDAVSDHYPLSATISY